MVWYKRDDPSAANHSHEPSFSLPFRWMGAWVLMAMWLIGGWITCEAPAFGASEAVLVDTKTVSTGDERLHLRLQIGEDASVREGHRWCANPEENRELHGTGYIVVRTSTGTERFSLGEQLYVEKNGGWTSPDEPLRVIRGPLDHPWAVVSQYANCNGFYYTVVRIEPSQRGPTLQRMTFKYLHGSPRTRVFGNRIGAWPGRNPTEWRLWVEGYDQAVLGPFRLLYRWIEGKNRLYLVGLTSSGGEAAPGDR